jgi:hypothetical protein
MGNRTSSTNKVTIDTSSSVKSVTNKMLQNSSATSQSAINMQTLKVKFAPTANVKGGDFTMSQSIKVNQSIFTQITTQLVQDMKTDMKTQLAAAVDQAASSKTDFASTGNASANNISAIKNAIDVSIENNMTVTNINKLVQQVVNTQNGEITFDGNLDLGKITLNQEIVVDQIAQIIMKTIIDDANTILTSGETDVQIAQKSSASASGLGDIWAALMDTISSIFQGYTYVAIAVVCLLCVAVIGAAILLLSPAGQRAVNKGVSKI